MHRDGIDDYLVVGMILDDRLLNHPSCVLGMTLFRFLLFLIHSNLLEFKSVINPFKPISSAFYFFVMYYGNFL